MNNRHGPRGPINLLPGAPTTRPFAARAIGDLGPGRLTGGSQSAGQSILQQAVTSPDQAVSAIGAVGSTQRTRNCKTITLQFSTPGIDSASGVYGFAQQLFPANPERKLLIVSAPWTNGTDGTPEIFPCNTGSGGVNFGLLLQQGPQMRTPITDQSQLSNYTNGLIVPLSGQNYMDIIMDMPSTNPVTLVVWQFRPDPGQCVAVNCSVTEGT